MLLFCYSLAQFLEMALGIWVIREIYPEKRVHSKSLKIIAVIVCLIWGILAVWNAWVSFVSNIFIIFNSVIFSVLILINLRTLYFEVFIWEFFYNVTLSLTKMLFLILEGVLEQKTMSEVNYATRNYKEIIGCFLIYIFLIVIIDIKKDILQLLKIILSKYKRALCFVCCMEWSMLTYSMYLGEKGFTTTDFVLHIIFILCAAMVIIYLLLNTFYQKIKADKLILDTFQIMLEKRNQALQTIYEQNNKKMHDVKHVMLYLGNCLEQGKIKEAKEHIYNYMGELKVMEQKMWTSFPFLDFVLNYQKMEMDKKEISFKLEVADLYSIPLEEAELGVVIGNLLDNAIEATYECEPQKRNVFFKIGNLNHMFLLSIRNTSIKAPNVKDGRLLTTKDDQYAHGLGVESVKRIVDKYNGNISFQYDNEHFEVDIII